jgi:adenylate cyclase
MTAAGMGRLAALLSGVVAALAGLSGILDPLEWKTWDLRVRTLTPDEPSGDRVALLLIDQKSLDFMAEEESIPWPWPRSLYVPVIEYCRRAGAKGILFDILYTEPSVFGVSDDEELAGAIRAGGDVVLAAAVAQGAFPIDVLGEAAAGVGNVGFEPDADGVFRRFPPFASGGAPSLPLAALTGIAGLSAARDGSRLTVGATSVPLDGGGRMIIRYRGPVGAIPSYSMASAIQSYVREEEGGEVALPRDLLEGRYVVLGMSAPGLLDLRPTPVGSVYPGAEIHATVLDNLLSGDAVHPTPRWLEATAAFLAAVLTAAVLGRFRKAWTGALLLPSALAAVALAGALFFLAGWWVPVVSPMLAVCLSFVSVRTADYATEGRQRRYLKHAFRHYLSPDVVEQILADPSRLALGGERKELTIFFSDLAGFTALSERLDPVALTSLLNLYLTEMTSVIQEEGGTVDKYEGDAIIAFWNAPLDQPDHAARALRACVGCIERLAEMNPRLEALAGSPLSMRIGVHTGTVVVGNMGSRDRFDYTVIGDAANLASRLEGLGKVFKSPIVVSEAAWLASEGAVEAREIGRVRVVGRSEPVRLFAPTARKGGPVLHPGWDRSDPRFGDGLKAYYAGDFAGALSIFGGLASDPVAGAYADECRRLAAASPEAWDGVWEMASK